MPRIDLGNRKFADLSRLPNNCPYCHKSIDPKFVTFNFSLNNLEVIFRCPNLDCNRVFIGIYRDDYNNDYSFLSTNIGEIQKKTFSDHIKTLSPNFVEIFNQAYFAENHELLEICGVGYRKALEFLIKDYLIKRKPEKEGEIKKKFLGKCIKEDVENIKVKKVAKRAVWLGNDETHYVRIWQDKDIENLKDLIDLMVSWIESEEKTKKYKQEMQKKS